MTSYKTRRQLLGATGSAALGVLAGCSRERIPGGTTTDAAPTTTEDDPWTVVDLPTEMTLYDVVEARTGPYAVGENGVVVGRRNGDWEVVVKAGPHAAENGLTGIDSTANGRHVWFCGESGALGLYAVDEDELTDVSAPLEKTSTWEDIAVAGLAGQEWLYVVNGSGELLRGKFDGNVVDWGDVTKPGSGSSAGAAAFIDRGTGYVADTSGNVFMTVDAGDEWRRIGIRDAGVDLSDVAPVGVDNVTVAGGDGTVFRYNGFYWTPLSAGSNDLESIVRSRREGLVVSGSGEVYELTRLGWRFSTRVQHPLYGVVLGSRSVPDVAVGGAGSVLERSR